MRAHRVLLLSAVLVAGTAAVAAAQKPAPRPETLTETLGLPRVAVIGLPPRLTDRVVEHVTRGKRFLPVEHEALQTALFEQRFGGPTRKSYLDQTLEKAIKDMDRVEAGTVWATGALARYSDFLKEVAGLGTAVGAHYLILGHVEKLTREQESVPVPYTRGKTLVREVHDARLRLRIVDVKTATVVGATSFRVHFSDNLYEGRVSDRDAYSILDEIGRLAAASFLDVVLPARILDLKPLLISRGSNDGLRKGDRYLIQREGKEIRGETGAVIGRLKSTVGQVEVVEVHENMALVKPIEGRDFRLRDLAVVTARAAAPEGGAVTEPAVPALSQEAAEPALPRIAVGLIRSGATAAEERKNIAVFTDTIISRLVQTKRFRVMDRQEVEQLLTEQLARALAEGRGLKTAMGSLKGADYMVFGSVSVFATEKEVVKLPHSTRTFEQLVGRVEGNLRIVDARSGEIKESRKVAVKKDLEASAEKSRLVTKLADTFAEEVVAVLMQALYPIKIVAIGQDGTLYLNRGKDGGVGKGEHLIAHRPGKPIVDPDTGARLGTEEVRVGEVVVNEVEDARSKAAWVSGNQVAVGDVLKRLPGSTRQVVAVPPRPKVGRLPQPPAPADRATLAVGTFRPAVGAPVVLSPAQLATLTNELIVKLTNTNRFRLMDRQEVDQLLDEKAFQAATSQTDIKALLRQLEGADYLVYGEISRFSIEAERVPFLKEDRAVGKGEATVRIVEVSTGAVVAADKISVKDTGSPAEQLSRLVDRFTVEVTSRLLARLFRIVVISALPDGTVYVNRGEDGDLRPGTVFQVMRPGKEMIDPDTGLSFGRAESVIGSLEIVSVEPSRSRGRVVAGETPEVGDVLRPVPDKKKPERKVLKPNF